MATKLELWILYILIIMEVAVFDVKSFKYIKRKRNNGKRIMDFLNDVRNAKDDLQWISKTISMQGNANDLDNLMSDNESENKYSADEDKKTYNKNGVTSQYNEQEGMDAADQRDLYQKKHENIQSLFDTNEENLEKLPENENIDADTIDSSAALLRDKRKNYNDYKNSFTDSNMKRGSLIRNYKDDYADETDTTRQRRSDVDNNANLYDVDRTAENFDENGKGYEEMYRQVRNIDTKNMYNSDPLFDDSPNLKRKRRYSNIENYDDINENEDSVQLTDYNNGWSGLMNKNKRGKPDRAYFGSGRIENYPEHNQRPVSFAEIDTDSRDDQIYENSENSFDDAALKKRNADTMKLGSLFNTAKSSLDDPAKNLNDIGLENNLQNTMNGGAGNTKNCPSKPTVDVNNAAKNIIRKKSLDVNDLNNYDFNRDYENRLDKKIEEIVKNESNDNEQFAHRYVPLGMHSDDKTKFYKNRHKKHDKRAFKRANVECDGSNKNCKTCNGQEIQIFPVLNQTPCPSQDTKGMEPSNSNYIPDKQSPVQFVGDQSPNLNRNLPYIRLRKTRTITYPDNHVFKRYFDRNSVLKLLNRKTTTKGYNVINDIYDEGEFYHKNQKRDKETVLRSGYSIPEQTANEKTTNKDTFSGSYETKRCDKPATTTTKKPCTTTCKTTCVKPDIQVFFTNLKYAPNVNEPQSNTTKKKCNKTRLFDDENNNKDHSSGSSKKNENQHSRDTKFGERSDIKKTVNSETISNAYSNKFNVANLNTNSYNKLTSGQDAELNLKRSNVKYNLNSNNFIPSNKNTPGFNEQNLNNFETGSSYQFMSPLNNKSPQSSNENINPLQTTLTNNENNQDLKKINPNEYLSETKHDPEVDKKSVLIDPIKSKSSFQTDNRNSFDNFNSNYFQPYEFDNKDKAIENPNDNSKLSENVNFASSQDLESMDTSNYEPSIDDNDKFVDPVYKSSDDSMLSEHNVMIPFKEYDDIDGLLNPSFIEGRRLKWDDKDAGAPEMQRIDTEREQYKRELLKTFGAENDKEYSEEISNPIVTLTDNNRNAKNAKLQYLKLDKEHRMNIKPGSMLSSSKQAEIVHDTLHALQSKDIIRDKDGLYYKNADNKGLETVKPGNANAKYFNIMPKTVVETHNKIKKQNDLASIIKNTDSKVINKHKDKKEINEKSSIDAADKSNFKNSDEEERIITKIEKIRQSEQEGDTKMKNKEASVKTIEEFDKYPTKEKEHDDALSLKENEQKNILDGKSKDDTLNADKESKNIENINKETDLSEMNNELHGHGSQKNKHKIVMSERDITAPSDKVPNENNYDQNMKKVEEIKDSLKKLNKSVRDKVFNPKGNIGEHDGLPYKTSDDIKNSFPELAKDIDHINNMLNDELVEQTKKTITTSFNFGKDLDDPAKKFTKRAYDNKDHELLGMKIVASGTITDMNPILKSISENGERNIRRTELDKNDERKMKKIDKREIDSNVIKSNNPESNNINNLLTQTIDLTSKQSYQQQTHTGALHENANPSDQDLSTLGERQTKQRRFATRSDAKPDNDPLFPNEIPPSEFFEKQTVHNDPLGDTFSIKHAIELNKAKDFKQTANKFRPKLFQNNAEVKPMNRKEIPDPNEDMRMDDNPQDVVTEKHYVKPAPNQPPPDDDDTYGADIFLRSANKKLRDIKSDDDNQLEEAMTGQLASRILTNVYQKAQSVGIPFADSLVRKEKPQKDGAYRSNATEESLHGSEGMLREVMKALHQVVDQQVYLRTCKTLSSTLQDFLHLITFHGSHRAIHFETIELKGTFQHKREVDHDDDPSQSSFLFQDPNLIFTDDIPLKFSMNQLYQRIMLLEKLMDEYNDLSPHEQVKVRPVYVHLKKYHHALVHMVQQTEKDLSDNVKNPAIHSSNVLIDEDFPENTYINSYVSTTPSEQDLINKDLQNLGLGSARHNFLNIDFNKLTHMQPHQRKRDVDKITDADTNDRLERKSHVQYRKKKRKRRRRKKKHRMNRKFHGSKKYRRLQRAAQYFRNRRLAETDDGRLSERTRREDDVMEPIGNGRYTKIVNSKHRIDSNDVYDSLDDNHMNEEKIE